MFAQADERTAEKVRAKTRRDAYPHVTVLGAAKRRVERSAALEGFAPDDDRGRKRAVFQNEIARGQFVVPLELAAAGFERAAFAVDAMGGCGDQREFAGQ